MITFSVEQGEQLHAVVVVVLRKGAHIGHGVGEAGGGHGVVVGHAGHVGGGRRRHGSHSSTDVVLLEDVVVDV